MADRLKRDAPESALMGIWQSMADAAKLDFALLAIKRGMSVADVAAQLDCSIPEIVTMLDCILDRSAGTGTDRC